MILKSHNNEIKTKTNPESTKLILTTIMNLILEKLIRESKQEHFSHNKYVYIIHLIIKLLQ